MLAPMPARSPWMTYEESKARAEEGRRLASIRLEHDEICSGVHVQTDPVESPEGGWYTHTVTVNGANRCFAYTTDEAQARENHARVVADLRARR